MKLAPIKVLNHELVWAVVCYSPTRGEYARFINPRESTAKFWLNWVKKNEPDERPRLQLYSLVPIGSEHG
jgi:hypothetical protein